MRRKSSDSTPIILGILGFAIVIFVIGLLLISPRSNTEKSSDAPLFAQADAGLRLTLQSAIVENCRTVDSHFRFICPDFKLLGVEKGESENDAAKVYALVYYAEYERFEDASSKPAFSVSAPAVMSAVKDEASPTLWRAERLTFPAGDANREGDIKELFPQALQADAERCDTKYMQTKCEALALEYFKKTGLVYPLSDFGGENGRRYSYYRPEPSRYAIESTRIDAAFTMDLNAGRFMLASDFSMGGNITGSMSFHEKSGDFVLTADNQQEGRTNMLVFHSLGDILVLDDRASTGNPAPAFFEDGAVFYPVNYANTQAAALGEVSADADGDGETESFCLGFGASAKDDILTLYATNGWRLKYYNSFISEYSDYALEKKDGKALVTARDAEGKRHEFEISTAVNRVFLTEEGGSAMKLHIPSEFLIKRGASIVSQPEGAEPSKVYYCIDPGDKLQYYAGMANIALFDKDNACTMCFAPYSNYIGVGSKYTYEDDGKTLSIDDGAYSYVFRVHGDMLIFDEAKSDAYSYFGSFTNGAVFSSNPPEIPAVG